jgi:pimeloyl-ACP methyl ester carboxylesterase
MIARSSLVKQLTEATSIATAEKIQHSAIATPLQADPIKTAYVKQGDNPSASPILLLHGFDSSLLEFRRLMPQLQPHRETWAVDLLGFGFTDRPANVAFDPAAIKTHLYSFWQTQIQRPVVLVGASMGGAAAIDFALTYPDAVAELVLLDSAGFAAGPAMGKLMIFPLDRLATGFLANAWVRQKISENAYCDRTLANEDARICAALHLEQPNWSRALIAFTKSGGYNFLSQKIQDISQPTLIIWGEQDRILGTQDATRFETAIAQSQLIWIPNCGHVPHLEQPDATAQAMLNCR